MLFLSMAMFRGYESDTDKVAKAVVYYFKEDGSTSVDKSDLTSKEDWEANTTLDVSANWEPYQGRRIKTWSEALENTGFAAVYDLR